jgi:hypothetical protein
MNRCCAYNKNLKKCRAKTPENNLFCCKSHEPINNEILRDGCFMCSEKIINSSEIIYFKCRHAFHKICYEEWLKYSTYSEKICIICRNTINYTKKQDDTKKFLKYNSMNKNMSEKIDTFNKINNILKISYYNSPLQNKVKENIKIFLNNNTIISID